MRVTAGLLPAEGPLFSAGRWLAAMGGRVPGSPYTFELGGAILHGTVAERPCPGEVFDLGHLLTADTPKLPLSAATRAARARRAAWPGCTPHLVVMLPGYECHALGPAGDDAAAVETLVSEIVVWARARGLRAVAFLYTRGPALERALGGQGFTGMPMSYSCELTPGTPLPARRAKEARRETRRLAEAGVRLRMTEIGRPVPGMVELKCGHSRKYGGSPDPAAVARRLRALCSGGALLFGAELGERLVGYGLFVPHRGTWYCVSTAMAYDLHEARHTYFATAFYEPARHAAEAGVSRLHYGHGAWRAKLSRGCRAVELPIWVLALDPELKPLIEWSARTTTLSP
ncbi:MULTISPECIES: GNAT family N-acetyltransferase [Nonomuraea]|uniref:GNAT family N-acetyltransferase n=1 Tax=Nonomuraea harbinensis TaxID=1286938 RepID=A0ABW1BN61_9ACTN|nr:MULTISPECIES: GNAT family N-acetyltransferase [Nonomuraea]TXK39568.1 GNAT family N-acetyltransferase [Nonomuraea sp. C10]